MRCKYSMEIIDGSSPLLGATIVRRGPSPSRSRAASRTLRFQQRQACVDADQPRHPSRSSLEKAT